MASLETLLSLVQLLLAAPGSDEGWSAFLRDLRHNLGGSAASFVSHDVSTHRGGIAVIDPIVPEALAAYQGHWHQYDPWARSPSTSTLATGEIAVGDQLVAQSLVQRTEFYGEFGRRYDIARCVIGMIETGPQRLSCLSINGSERRRPFGSEEIKLLEALMPHVQTALRIHRRLAAAESSSLAGAAVLDRLPTGVIFVGRDGHVLSVNRAAADIVRRRDGLLIDRGQLRGGTERQTSALRTAIGTAVAIGAGGCLEATHPLTMARERGRPLSVVVVPMPGIASSIPDAAVAAAVFVTDPDRRLDPELELIEATLHLTRSEAKLVRCLVDGCSLAESACQLRLSLETIRSRLKIIFQKTHTHRQAELVRLAVAVFSTSG